ncbi:hypothetical protein [Thermostichus vulcanus]|uniref:Response regulatory domain-containing protein n=1 Tax=Thermostichus vulcanus str. 'Rupite' TaxID=2813851 RepID=A0ABT0CF22_THEVL|nr:hypothetical protein [Thermostichus vulcanus]MCJ2544383.1 hypothetical protein [Thermostichus vulcanus str. 'Rupite']
MTSALREMPIGINAYVRYRGCDFNLLCRYRNEILRVKQLYQNLAACFTSNPEELVWMPIRDLEHVALSELQKILNPSPPVPVKLYTVPEVEAPTRKTQTPTKAPAGQHPNTPTRNTHAASTRVTQSQARAAATPTSNPIKTSNPTPAVRRVLISQADPFQAKLWQLALGSQGVQVILADAAGELEGLLDQVKKYRPHLLIQDMGATHFNPYEFCRDCHSRYPQLPILLTHAVNRAIADGEKRWATLQGAADIIPALKPSVQELIPSLVYVLGRLQLPSPDVETLKRSLRPKSGSQTNPAVPAPQGSRSTGQAIKMPSPSSRPTQALELEIPSDLPPHHPNRPSLMAFIGMPKSEPKPMEPRNKQQAHEQLGSWLKKCWQVLHAPV